jgi:hypothetical protein
MRFGAAVEGSDRKCYGPSASSRECAPDLDQDGRVGFSLKLQQRYAIQPETIAVTLQHIRRV